MKLSVVLATRNEEENIKRCLDSVTDIASEIIVFDESSTDNTREIARSCGAKVYKVKHESNFHITKKNAFKLAKYEWILQLDADEELSKELREEIRSIINLSNSKLLNRRIDVKKEKLFIRHQKALEKRDGNISLKNGEVNGFFIPRINYFIGKPLIHAGVYPDGVIRLVKNKKSYFPAQNVHEQIIVKGVVKWLENPLLHYDSPTLTKYLQRLERYTTLKSYEYKNNKIEKNLINLLKYSLFLPSLVFLKLYIRHKGFLDGIRGFLWSVFSAMHYPISYFKYFTDYENRI